MRKETNHYGAGNRATVWVSPYSSPCGGLWLGAFGERLCLCDWVSKESGEAVRRQLQGRLNARFEPGCPEVLAQAAAELDEYFAGKRKTFDVPLLFAGTAFRQAVWQELLRIPYGATASYREIAERIGNPKAVRAVAAANAANPMSLFVPCHRVIGSDRRLAGYGGGLAVKAALLAMEQRYV